MTPEDIDLLDALQEKRGGVMCVQNIVLNLRRGEIDLASYIRRIEGDKTRVYPEIEKQLLQMFGCRLHGQHECPHWLCT